MDTLAWPGRKGRARRWRRERIETDGEFDRLVEALESLDRKPNATPEETDNESVDRTAEIARSFGATVVRESVHNIARVRNSFAARRDSAVPAWGKTSQPLLEDRWLLPAPLSAGAATVTVSGKELGLSSATTLAFGRLCAALRRHPVNRLLLRLLATARRSQALASLR